MTKRIQTYESDAIVVTFDPNLCIHSARCLAGLPAVFDVRQRRWIAPEAAPASEIAAVIERCPSGALQYHRLDGEPDEQPPAESLAGTAKDGPLVIRGEVELRDAEGGLLRKGTRFTLCRCGTSGNKPFCDNSHRTIGFQAP